MFMRLIVFFDLPVKTEKEKRAYIQFRKDLIKDGYYMIQYSVYGRLCNGIDSVNKFTERLKKIVPCTGSVRALSITEKQYASIMILAGQKKEREKDVKYFHLSFF